MIHRILDKSITFFRKLGNLKEVNPEIFLFHCQIHPSSTLVLYLKKSLKIIQAL